MIYANKKIVSNANSAQQTAKIIATVSALVEKNLIKLTADTVYLNPSIWKDKIVAINWINCLHHYYCLKKQYKISQTLYFKHIETDELIGSMMNKKPKVLIFK